ncbi:MAG TPA: signal peptidase I [Acidimicrobiales bacterium]|nr:signal peptidase I [Acidimicrobiales bacterium]
MALDVMEPAGDVPAPPKRRSRRRALTEWLIVLVVAVLASFLVRTYVVQTYFIPSKSMEPTLDVGNRIVVDKLAVEFGHINIGDIVVFKAPPEVQVKCGDVVPDLVKRVIGLPGDVLTSKGNTIYVNGVALDEKWTHTEPLGPAIGHVTVPAGQYFMMGDNHANSCDSRYWGTVPRSDIIGKVFLKFWPLSEWHWY